MFVYKIDLKIPAGFAIEETIHAVFRFFETSGSECANTVAECLDIDIPIPVRIVSESLKALQQDCLKALLNPDKWVNKELMIVFEGNNTSIFLDEKRTPSWVTKL